MNKSGPATSSLSTDPLWRPITINAIVTQGGDSLDIWNLRLELECKLRQELRTCLGRFRIGCWIRQALRCLLNPPLFHSILDGTLGPLFRILNLWGGETLFGPLCPTPFYSTNRLDVWLQLGPYINDVSQSFRIFDPFLSPFQYQLHATFLPLVRIWLTPLTSQSDIIYVWPLTLEWPGRCSRLDILQFVGMCV